MENYIDLNMPRLEGLQEAKRFDYDPTLRHQLHPRTFTDGFSQSEIETWDTCAFKWYLQYGNRITLRGMADLPMGFGTAMHARFAKFYSTGTMGDDLIEPGPDAVLSSKDSEKLDHLQAVLDALTDAYAQYYADDLKLYRFNSEGIEQIVDLTVEYKGHKIRFRATIDITCLTPTKLEVSWDHKSTGLLNAAVVEGWNFKFQFMFYAWIHWQMNQGKQKHEFIFNAIKKTQLRLKQGENWLTFRARVTMDMLSRPAEYFNRGSIEFNSESIDTFEREVLFPKLDRIILLQDALKAGNESLVRALTMNKVTTACHNWNRTCQYFKICTEGWHAVDSLYQFDEPKHSNYIQIELE